MSDTSTWQDDPQAPETDQVTRSRKDLRGLEAAAREGRKAQAELAQVQRDLALTRAGIPDTGPGKLFLKAYDGELTQDAILAAATEYGIIGDKTNPPPSEAELAALARMSNNAAGGQSAPGQDIMAELLAATNEREVMAVATKYDLKGIDLRNYGG